MSPTEGSLAIADALGVDESFCPVRAMLGAFVSGQHFPIPDLLVCSVGATCDDFSAIAQRLNGLGYPILWWEMPARRAPDADEEAVVLPGGFTAPASQVAFVRQELQRVGQAMQDAAGRRLNETDLTEGIRQANRLRRLLAELRELAFTAEPCPLPALELLIAEMLAIHFCSDQRESIAVIAELLDEVRRRVGSKAGVLPAGAVKVFWVNPVADLRAMNVLEDCGGRLCGTEYLFCHALDEIPQDVPPWEALARTALADPMVGPSADRARRICRDAARLGAEAMVVSRIPGASHCALEGRIIKDVVERQLSIPVGEIEVPCLMDALLPSVRTRLEALMEAAGRRRKP
jgi:benzoyl-CoA reductase/2-hydroxyglutaryl-CoA dehydratase subunit BcrC/BadD/HgdB